MLCTCYRWDLCTCYRRDLCACYRSKGGATDFRLRGQDFTKRARSKKGPIFLKRAHFLKKMARFLMIATCRAGGVLSPSSVFTLFSAARPRRRVAPPNLSFLLAHQLYVICKKLFSSYGMSSGQVTVGVNLLIILLNSLG